MPIDLEAADMQTPMEEELEILVTSMLEYAVIALMIDLQPRREEVDPDILTKVYTEIPPEIIL